MMHIPLLDGLTIGGKTVGYKGATSFDMTVQNGFDFVPSGFAETGYFGHALVILGHTTYYTNLFTRKTTLFLTTNLAQRYTTFGQFLCTFETEIKIGLVSLYVTL